MPRPRGLKCKTNTIPILMHLGAYSQKILRLRLNFVNTVMHLCFFNHIKLIINACNKTSILTWGLLAFSWVYRRNEILIVVVRSFENRYPDAHFDYSSLCSNAQVETLPNACTYEINVALKYTLLSSYIADLWQEPRSVSLDHHDGRHILS
jgi:hypothetical protein